MVFTKELVVNLFMLVIYIIILYIFNKAKNRYSGGMIVFFINLIIFSVFLMLCADYVPLLSMVIPADFVYIIRVISAWRRWRCWRSEDCAFWRPRSRLATLCFAVPSMLGKYVYVRAPLWDAEQEKRRGELPPHPCAGFPAALEMASGTWQGAAFEAFMKKVFTVIIFSFLLLIFFRTPVLSAGPDGQTSEQPPSLAARLTIMPLLSLYQNHLRAFSVTQCPSWPNCSHYSQLAVKKHGAWMGIFMTVDRLMHEGGQIKQGKTIFTADRGFLVYDPLESNDYWWQKPEQPKLPDIPQLAGE